MNKHFKKHQQEIEAEKQRQLDRETERQRQQGLQAAKEALRAERRARGEPEDSGDEKGAVEGDRQEQPGQPWAAEIEAAEGERMRKEEKRLRKDQKREKRRLREEQEVARASGGGEVVETTTTNGGHLKLRLKLHTPLKGQRGRNNLSEVSDLEEEEDEESLDEDVDSDDVSSVDGDVEGETEAQRKERERVWLAIADSCNLDCEEAGDNSDSVSSDDNEDAREVVFAAYVRSEGDLRVPSRIFMPSAQRKQRHLLLSDFLEKVKRVENKAAEEARREIAAGGAFSFPLTGGTPGEKEFSNNEDDDDDDDGEDGEDGDHRSEEDYKREYRSRKRCFDFSLMENERLEAEYRDFRRRVRRARIEKDVLLDEMIRQWFHIRASQN